MPVVSVEDRGAISIIRIDRPEKLNAISQAVAVEMQLAFKAFDADTGQVLWSFQTGSGVEGQPITWEADGVQYVAVTSGMGGVYWLYGNDAELKSTVPQGGMLWVFALSDKR